MLIRRRDLLQFAASAAALPAMSGLASAQAYPARPVRFVVGFAPGGPNDILARLIGEWLTSRLGQPFAVDNLPGGSSNPATEVVVRAPPDGYTILLMGPANAINASLFPKLSFDIRNDIVPVAGAHPRGAGAGRASFGAGVDRSRADRLCQGQPGQAADGDDRRRLVAACVGQAVPADDRRRRGGAALRRRRAGIARHDRRQGRHDVRADVGVDRAAAQENVARARGDDGAALGGVSRASADERHAARLRGERSDRHRHAARHAGRGHRHPQQGGQRRLCRSQDARAPDRHRRRAAAGLARRISERSSPARSRSGARSSRRPA